MSPLGGKDFNSSSIPDFIISLFKISASNLIPVGSYARVYNVFELKSFVLDAVLTQEFQKRGNVSFALFGVGIL